MQNLIPISSSELKTDEGQIAVYQFNDSVELEVLLQDENIWLTQAQMAQLFETTPQNITLHIGNVYKEAELEQNPTCKDFLQVRQEGKRTVQRVISFYNLDVIISVGYRVKSQQGVLFRQWATRVLKDYALKGYAVNQRFERIENFAIDTEKRVAETEKKIDFFVKTALPPVEGILFDGQTFDAYVFVSNLIKSAKKSIVLIDNYVDETVLLLLSKRKKNVSAKILTASFSQTLQQDLAKHNEQYPPIHIEKFTKSHDRFLIIDNKEIYFIGASLKDLGKKWFAFSKMSDDWILSQLP